MALVTLIKSAETHLRDAVVQIEDWFLPKEAEFTGKVDAEGRAIFTLLKTEETKVVAEVEKVESEIKSEFDGLEEEFTANTANTG